MTRLPRESRSYENWRADDHEEQMPKKPIDINYIYTIRHFELPARYTHMHAHEKHEEYEMIYVEKGVFLDRSEDKDVVMHAGDAVVYGRNYPHRNNCDGEHSASIFITTFACDSELMREVFTDNSRTFVRIAPEQREILAAAFNAGVKAYDINGHWCRLKSEPPHINRQIYINYIEVLFLQLINGLKEEKATERIFLEHNDSRSDVTSQVIGFLKSRVYSSVSIDEICKTVGYSRGHVCNLFKKDTGKTVNDYFQSLKIEEAKRLILETNRDFGSISETLGYSNPQYFNKVFRQLTGHTPGNFRKTIFKGSLETDPK